MLRIRTKSKGSQFRKDWNLYVVVTTARGSEAD